MDSEQFQYGLLAVYAVIALAAVGSTVLSYFLLRRQSEPHVVVYTKHDKDRPSLILLMIENVGKGVAYDVSFDLSRPIPKSVSGLTPTGKKKEFEQMDEGPLIDGIPALAPGDYRVWTWGQYGGLMDALEGESVRVVSRFKSRGPYLLRPKKREVESILEVGSFTGTDATASPERKAVKALDEIAGAIEDLAECAKEPLVQQRWKDLLEGDDETPSGAEPGGEEKG